MGMLRCQAPFVPVMLCDLVGSVLPLWAWVDHSSSRFRHTGLCWWLVSRVEEGTPQAMGTQSRHLLFW